MEDNFSLDQGMGDDFGMIQAHYIYCAHYFYYYYINFTSDHQALDPGGWDPSVWMWRQSNYPRVRILERKHLNK